jgi:hypothetical protein
MWRHTALQSCMLASVHRCKAGSLQVVAKRYALWPLLKIGAVVRWLANWCNPQILYLLIVLLRTNAMQGCFRHKGAVGAILQFWGYYMDWKVRDFLQQILRFCHFPTMYIVRLAWSIMYRQILHCWVVDNEMLNFATRQNKVCCFVISYSIGQCRLWPTAHTFPLYAARRVLLLTAWTLRVTVHIRDWTARWSDDCSNPGVKRLVVLFRCYPLSTSVWALPSTRHAVLLTPRCVNFNLGSRCLSARLNNQLHQSTASAHLPPRILHCYCSLHMQRPGCGNRVMASPILC